MVARVEAGNSARCNAPPHWTARITFRAVPTTSTFFGITIRRYYNDHPPVHFPARFQGLAGKSTFDGEMINGRISFPIAGDWCVSGQSCTERKQAISRKPAAKKRSRRAG